jgi:hypothetical protein
VSELPDDIADEAAKLAREASPAAIARAILTERNRAEAAEKRVKDQQAAWKDSEEELLNCLEAAEKRAKDAEYEAKRYCQDVARWHERAEAAEKERDKLRKGLEVIANWRADKPSLQQEYAQDVLAALEAKS